MKKTTVYAVLAASLAFTSVAAAHCGHDHDHDHAHEHAHHHTDYTAQFVSAAISTLIEVEGCWIRNIPTPAPSAGYFVVKNNGTEAITLLAANSTQYDDLMLHQTVDEDGMAKMKMADDIKIEAGESLEFKPGGYHAMLERPVSAVSVGEQVDLELLFDNQQKVVAQCAVKAPGARSATH